MTPETYKLLDLCLRIGFPIFVTLLVVSFWLTTRNK